MCMLARIIFKKTDNLYTFIASFNIPPRFENEIKRSTHPFFYGGALARIVSAIVIFMYFL